MSSRWDGLAAPAAGKGAPSSRWEGMEAGDAAAVKVKHPGVLARAGQILRGVPAGLAQSAEDLVKSPYYVSKAWVKTAAHGFSAEEAAKQSAQLKKDLPAFSGAAEGVRNTGNRVVHPTKAVRDYKADPLGTLLEDASTVGMVAGGAGAALKGAGAAGAGAKVAAVGRAADAVAGAPLAPLKLLPKGAGLIGDRALAAAIEGRSGNTAAVLSKLSPKRAAVVDELLRGSAEEGVARRTAERQRQRLERILPDADEQAAYVETVQGTAGVLSQMRTALGKEGFDKYVTERFKGSLSPKAAHLAADVVEGKAPDVAERIARAAEDSRPAREARTEEYIAADPDARSWQRGMDPNWQALEQTRAGAQDLADRADLSPSQSRKLVAGQMAKAMDALENAPSRLRPRLAETDAAATYLRENGLADAATRIENELGATLADLKAKGVDADHLFHVLTDERAQGAARPAGHGTHLPQTGPIGSEKLRTGSPVYDRTLDAQAQGEARAAVAHVRRQTAERIAKLPFARRFDTPAEAAAAGYVAWRPDALFDRAGNLRATTDYLAETGGRKGVAYVPKPLFDEFVRQFQPRQGQVLGLVADLPNRIKYTAGLALSPAWLVGQVVGNSVMALAKEADSPALFGRQLVAVLKDRKASGYFKLAEESGGARLLHTGSSAAERSRLTEGVQGKTGALARASRALDKVASPGFRAGAFVDNVFRSAVYMTELTKAGNAEAAVRAALRATGEFDRMTPFERDVVRRAVPYFAWTREITRIAFHMAEDHPVRTAWALHLGDLATQDPERAGLSDWDEGALLFGDTLVGTGQLFPYAEVGERGKGGLFGFGKNLGPAARLLYAFGTNGQNPSTGKPYSAPPGTKAGRGDILKAVARQTIPQTRLLDAATGRDQVARYSTGDQVQTKTGTIPTGRTLPKALLEQLGLSLRDRKVSVGDALRMAEAQAAREERDTKTRQRSQRRAGGGTAGRFAGL